MGYEPPLPQPPAREQVAEAFADSFLVQKPCRIAFLTPEFVTEYQRGGGLGAYLARMGRLLVEAGHEPEIFVPSRQEPKLLWHDGVRVHRVPVFAQRAWQSMLARILRVSKAGPDWQSLFHWLIQAQSLADAMEQRHREAPFQMVQSADYLGVGCFVRHKTGRVHVVRCSSAADLYNQIDAQENRLERWRARLERRTIRRADCAYAPSNFIAQHFRTRHGLEVSTLRPPVSVEVPALPAPPIDLPERFFVHFGQFNRRKGTLWLLSAFEKAIQHEPRMQLLLVGHGYEEATNCALREATARCKNIQVIPALQKTPLYSIVRQACAAVLPSLVDNLPNTVIESLSLGVPVIGTRGGSIDELVEQDVTGELVEPDDVNALAATLVKVWQGRSAVKKGFVWQRALCGDLSPSAAINGFLSLRVAP